MGGRLSDMLHIAAQMKADGVNPNLATYHYLLKACAHGGWHQEARAVIEDMQQLGIKPDRQALHYLMQVR